MKNIEYFQKLGTQVEDRKWVRKNVGKYVSYKNYQESIRMGAEEYELSDPPYNEEDTVMFLDALKEAGIERFCYTAKTTITMDFLYTCKENGWCVVEVGNLRRVNDVFGEEEIRGIWVKSV